jgi:hypothetical protein
MPTLSCIEAKDAPWAATPSLSLEFGVAATIFCPSLELENSRGIFLGPVGNESASQVGLGVGVGGW